MTSRSPRGRLTSRHAAIAALLLATGIVAAPAVADVSRPAVAAITAGTYTGTITDPDGEPSTYTASVHLVAKPLMAGQITGTVRYSAAFNSTSFAPALACTGTLKFLGRSGRRFRFREAISGGANAQCISGGVVTLTRQSSRVLAYVWTMRGFSDPAPTGRLTRKG